MFHTISRVARSIRLRRAENDLRQLPDHMLKDIGISRSEISFAVRERNYRRT
ncbi:DUF1127 domain-containing protein [Mesorhizobium denitrificans]|uniref:DUF1127 domain-containing protein n=2 Tax=Mesorhizobium denitrificans TaxID=2294114 RepID=A0A371X9I1_9HYPH|nr:DUF1127 domain-containing protein [Mesorhizobium denitrificans]RFC65860.1 DUF1127 domain-containing protein [Mesorhizobium denitrificans]